MKFKFYLAAAFAVALMGCKNDAKPADAKAGSTAAKTGAAVENQEENTAATDAGETPVQETADGKVLLRLNYPKGFEQELAYDMDMGVGKEMSNKIYMVMGMKVVSVSGDKVPVYGMTAKITHMKMDSKVMGREIKYDSSKKASLMTPEEKSADVKVREILDKEISYSLNNRGKEVGKMKFEGGDDALVSQFLDMENLQMAFPENPVGVGESWENEVKGKKMAGAAKNTYTIKNITDDEVEIALKSVIEKIEGTSKEIVIKGSYTLDRNTGMLKKGSMAGNLDVQGMEGSLKMTFTGKRVK